MISVLRNPTYRTLFSAHVIALLGTGLLTIALGLLAFDLAGSDAGAVLGTALTIKMLAYVGVAPLIAALVDRLPKKVVLVSADVVRGGIALMLPFVTETWQIFVLVFVLQSASATFTPAFQSLIPSILPDPVDYTKALSLSRLAYDLEALVSAAIAALLLTVISYNNLFLGTMVGFAGSAVLVLVARIPASSAAPAEMTFWPRAVEGIRVFARTSSLRFLLLLDIAVAAGYALVLVNSIVYIKGVFGLDDSALALALAMFGVGSLIVTLNIPSLVGRFGVQKTMLGGAVVIAAGLTLATLMGVLASASSTAWWMLLAAWVILGAGTSLINTPSSRLLVDASTPENRNLVYTAQFSLSHACFLVTYPLAGWLGTVSLPLTAGVLLAVSVVAGGAAAMRWSRDRDRRVLEQAHRAGSSDRSDHRLAGRADQSTTGMRRMDSTPPARDRVA